MGRVGGETETERWKNLKRDGQSKFKLIFIRILIRFILCLEGD